jgi:thiol-disulfide isomerase/thioredoxin
VPRERQAQCTLADLEQLRAAALGPGRLRVINHWATWCIPCVEEFPQLKALQASIAERHGEEVDFFGISWDLFDPRGEEEEIIDHVENFGVGHHLRWPTLLVAEAVPPADFFATLGITVEKVPQTWVVAADGRLVRRWDGLLKAEDLPVLLATLETAR